MVLRLYLEFSGVHVVLKLLILFLLPWFVLQPLLCLVFQHWDHANIDNLSLPPATATISNFIESSSLLANAPAMNHIRLDGCRR